MAYIAGINRYQASLLPTMVDDYVEADSSVRVIDASVENLDVSALGFQRSTPAPTGRPGYDPCDLLKLYLYAYLNEIRSSRRKDLLELEDLTVVADTGYSNGNAAAACEDDGIIACVPVKRSVNNRGDGNQFDRSRFIYDAARDQFTCPAGRILHRKGPVNRSGYTYVSWDCSGCELKSRCTQSERRWVSRHQHEDALERMAERVAASPDLMRLRRCAAEHPFGTIKRMMIGRFLTRGIKGTSTEMALSVMAFNLKRCINLKARPV